MPIYRQSVPAKRAIAMVARRVHTFAALKSGVEE
jgi:hypothetical protein